MPGYSFTLGGIHCSTFGVIARTTREMLPARENREISVPGRHGTFDAGSPVFGKRAFTFSCFVGAESMANLRTAARQIAKWLADAETLVFDDDPGKLWTGRVYEAAELNTVASTGEFSFVFEAQPFAEDTEETTGAIGTEQDYGSQLEFWPTIAVTMTAAATSLQVSHLGSGSYILISDDLEEDDIISISMQTGKVTKNSMPIMDKLSLDSLFFPVPPGDQTITVETDGACTAEITYRKVFL